MTQARDEDQSQESKGGGLAGSIAMGALMVLVSAPVLIHEARSTGHASLVPWLLAGGPTLGLVLTWLGGSFRTAPNTTRAQATHFGLVAAMVVSLLLVIALDGPTGIVVMTNLYCCGWLLLTLSFALWNQRRTGSST